MLSVYLNKALPWLLAVVVMLVFNSLGGNKDLDKNSSSSCA